MVVGIIFWLVFAILVGVFWESKGKGFGSGFIVALLLSPLVGFIIGLVIKPDITKQEKDAISQGRMKKCPYCAELIKREAKVCRYCGRDLPEAEEIPDPEPTKLNKKGGFKCPHCNLTLWLKKYRNGEVSTKVNGNYIVNCYYCHKKVIIEKQIETSKVDKKTRLPQAKKGTMIYCPYCGKKTSGNEQVCLECKKDISKIFEESEYECRNCKKDIPEDALYCWHCGEKFE